MVSSSSSFSLFKEHEKLSASIDLQKTARIYQWIIIVGSSVMYLWAAYNFPPVALNLDFIILSALTIMFSSRLFLQLPELQTNFLGIGLSDAVLYFVLLQYGGEAAILLAAIDALVNSYRMSQQGMKMSLRTALFNAAAFSSSIGGAALAIPCANYFQKLTDLNSSVVADNNIRLMFQMIAMYIASIIINSTLGAIRQSLWKKSNFLIEWKEYFYGNVLTYSFGAVLATITFYYFQQSGWYAVGGAVLIVASFYIAFKVYTQRLQKSFDDLRHSEQKFHHAALHDKLTDLPNRTHLFEKLKLYLTAEENQTTARVAVLLVNLVRFKSINDNMGHTVGDELLRNVGKRLQNAVRRNDADLVARLDGATFAVLLTDIGDADAAIRFARRVQAIIEEPFEVNKRIIVTAPRIGIAISSDQLNQPEDLLRGADIAMYWAKDQKTDCEVFSSVMSERAASFLETEAGLRRALKNNELVLHYQPIVALWSGHLVGFETLVRWQDPERGLLFPDKFISIAEETGLIIPMTLEILQRSCQQLKEWQSRSQNNSHLMMSVNLSSRNFADPDLADQVKEILLETKLEPQYLKLEITESAAMEDVEETIRQMEKLRALGVQLSIDDFGTGHSNLSYLHRFPINFLKIDRSFVQRMGKNGENTGIVEAILMLAKDSKLEVIAEGVETIEQLETLRKIGCGYAQGYLMSKPQGESEMSRLMKEKEHWLPENVERVEVSASRMAYLPEKAQRHQLTKNRNY